MRNSEQHSEKGAVLLFSAPAERGTRTAAGVFVPDGRGVFSLRFSGELRSAERGNVPRPAAGQEGRHQGFYPLNSHFLLFLSLAQTGDRRPLRKGERQRIFSTVGEHSVLPCRDIFAVSYNVLLHMWFQLRRARHTRVAQLFNALYRTAPADYVFGTIYLRRCCLL